MSETEDDGGIDKEALREELREKYEQDDQKRESTQRMSDLLLKGATMTNSHCSTCGDPIFRQSGTNFCPTCHGGPEGVEAAVETDGQQADGNGQGTTPADGGGTDANAAEPDATRADADIAETNADVAAAGSDPADAHSFESAGSSTNPDATQSASMPGEPTDEPTPEPGRDATFDAGGLPGEQTAGDVETAHELLTATLERFAREAVRSEDPRYALECLEAAHEAADALAALRR